LARRVRFDPAAPHLELVLLTLASLPPGFSLETRRLTLREWYDDDFDMLHAICTCPEVMATIGPLHDEAQTRALLERLQQRQVEHGCSFWAMERRSDGRVLGFCGISRGTVSQIAGELEIGWRIARDCWGQSYAREAAEGALRWAAEAHPGQPVWAITSVGNARSRGLMERLGMVHRPDLDFPHPAVADDSPLKAHVTYWLEAA
jgi:RimJ/RimL family protein N-acetyltransferase